MSIKVPPSSVEAERSILGAVLLDAESMIQVSDVVNEKDFYDKNHGIIFSAMLELYQKNRPIDVLTVRQLLEDKKQLDTIGGKVYLLELTDSVPSVSNVYQYAKIVKDKSVLRKLIHSGIDIQGFGFQEDGEINALLEKAEQSLFSVTQTFIKDKLVHIKDVLDARFEEHAAVNEDPSSMEKHRVKTGFSKLDYKLQGLKPGDMVILAARPSMGKTALSLNFAQNIGKGGKKVAIFSLEMSKEQLTDRMICAEMEVDSWKLQKGELSDEEFSRIGEAMDELSKSNIYIDDSAAMTLLEIKSKCRRLKIESGLDMIIIDYLQLINGTNPNNRIQEIGEISRGIKALAREIGVPIIALSQLSRAVESRATKEPVLSDLRESGSIEQDADIVMMLYREDYYVEMDEHNPDKGKTTVFVRKNRNGPVGHVDMKFDAKRMKFHEVAEEYSANGF